MSNKLIMVFFGMAFVVLALFIWNQESKGTIKRVPTSQQEGIVIPTSSSNGQTEQDISPTIESTRAVTDDIIEDVKELKIEDIKIGIGDEAVSGKKVTVNYLGYLTNKTKFDSSYDRGEPFSFNLGAGQVIKGWDQGVVGMKVGGKRKLTIPSDLGYGPSGAGGSIPPNATLIFEVELLKVD